MTDVHRIVADPLPRRGVDASTSSWRRTERVHRARGRRRGRRSPSSPRTRRGRTPRRCGASASPRCNAGATRICLADTAGHATPIARDPCRRASSARCWPGSPEGRTGSTGTGTTTGGSRSRSRSTAAWAGADRLHATVLGVGERVGQPADGAAPRQRPDRGVGDADARRGSRTTSPLASPDPGRRRCRPAAPMVGRDAFRTATGVHAAADPQGRRPRARTGSSTSSTRRCRRRGWGASRRSRSGRCPARRTSATGSVLTVTRGPRGARRADASPPRRHPTARLSDAELHALAGRLTGSGRRSASRLGSCDSITKPVSSIRARPGRERP